MNGKPQNGFWQKQGWWEIPRRRLNGGGAFWPPWIVPADHLHRLWYTPLEDPEHVRDYAIGNALIARRRTCSEMIHSSCLWLKQAPHVPKFPLEWGSTVEVSPKTVYRTIAAWFLGFNSNTRVMHPLHGMFQGHEVDVKFLPRLCEMRQGPSKFNRIHSRLVQTRTTHTTDLDRARWSQGGCKRSRE